MANIKDWIKDKVGNIFIPKTLTSAVYDDNNIPLSETLQTVNNAISKDYVIERTSNYVKWASGRAEVWLLWSSNEITFPNVISPFAYSDAIMIDLPITFVRITNVQASAYTSGLAWAMRPGASATQASLYIMQYGPATRPGSVYMYITGYWR